MPFDRPVLLKRFTAGLAAPGPIRALLLTTLWSVPSAHAHPGRTDSDGCHSAAAGRHCHHTPTANSAVRLNAHVLKVVDGDTVVVRILDFPTTPVTVRLKGIDCPESHENPKCKRDGDCASDIEPGIRAAAKMAEVVDGKSVVLVSSVNGEFERDDYGRTLAYVDLPDGTDVGLSLVRGGYCADWSHKYPHPRSAAYLTSPSR